MYEKYETDISQSYLKKVFSVLEEPICLMGGWAVHEYVNNNFQKARGRGYIGSRDIDLGFQISKKWAEKELKNSMFAKSLNVLEKKLGFELQGFRLLKQFHTESKKELLKEEAEKTAPAFIFDLYVDLMVSVPHPLFKKAFGFVPAEELLLEKVFENPANRLEIELFEKKIYLPSLEVLLAMKLNSAINRDKEHKRLKDLYDIVALSLYSDKPVDKEKLKVLYKPGAKNKEKLLGILGEYSKDEFWRDLFGISGEVAKKTILAMIE